MNYRTFLKEELEKRQKKDGQYSLRTFAKFLQISPTSLSHVLNKKRDLSKKMLGEILERLGISEAEKKTLLQSHKSYIDDSQFITLQEDIFETMCNWYHFAIVSLSNMAKNSSSPQWVAERLGISKAEAEAALNRLVRLGLINIVADKMYCTHENIKTTADTPSQALRTFHKQMLSMASQSIQDVPVELRELTSVTMSFEKKDIRVAKNMIKKFKRMFTSRLESRAGDEVYSLLIQLIPLTKQAVRQ